MANSMRRDNGGDSKKQWALYCVIPILCSYAAFDFYIHRGKAAMCRYCSRDFRNGTAPEPDVCATRDGHYDVTSSSRGKELNPWNQTKWVGEAATCRVKGHMIEKLDDSNNLRRGYALKFTPDVMDKTHLLPWLLGTRIDLNRRARRVYLDLGANRFESSVEWFLRMYPCDFTEIHAFEMDPGEWEPPASEFNEELNWLPESMEDSVLVNTTPSIPAWMMERVKVHFQVVSDRDDPSTNSIDISRFIKQELKLKPSDTVVIKMDIEGAEWPVLGQWMNDPEMLQIIDELFVEIHYWHPTMRVFGWDSYAPITREDACRLLADLRWRGYYAHFWP